MTKYLFLLAFILPFMAIGQGISCNKCWPKIAPTEKDSIIKGWIVYYKKGLVTKQWTTMCYSTLNGHYPIKVSSTKQGVQQIIREAAAHYKPWEPHSDGGSFITWAGNQPWEIYKIEVDGKPFDLNKYYQFIPENQVVE